MGTKKAPGGVEDLTFGMGTTQQVRNGQVTTITQVNASHIPFTSTQMVDAKIREIESVVTAQRIDLDRKAYKDKDTLTDTIVNGVGLVSTGLGNQFLADDGKYKAIPGGGDMLKSVYDSNDSGVVDDSERLGGQLPTFYATQSDLHSHANKSLLDSLTDSGAGDQYLADDGTYKAIAGGGDMLKSVYDTNDNGIVDDSERLGGTLADEFALLADVPADTDSLPEGSTNLYYTDARVEANTEVSANTSARHTHSNQAVLDALTDAGSGSVITQAERDKLADAVVSDLGTDPGEQVINMVAMLQADYDAITPDPNTLYIILPTSIKEPVDGPAIDDPIS